MTLPSGLPKRFRVLRKLGEGGMGVVYEAHDEERGARVALKVLTSLTPDSLTRFKREFRALADVNHPNLVSLGELVSEGEQWFFTMELVEGADFLEYVRPEGTRPAVVHARSSGISSTDPGRHSPSSLSRVNHALGVAPTIPPPPTPALAFDEARLRSALGQLARALQALHAAGMVHRDVKPSNIRVNAAGRLVLLDFGLVAELASGRSSAGGRAAGTPAYMAPEQAASSAVGPPADWYAVGVLLYEALTGELPFEGTALQVLLGKQRDAAAPGARVAGLPRDLDALCARLLRLDPDARPRAEDLIRALTGDGVVRTLAPTPTLAPLFVGRRREIEALRKAHASVQSAGEAVTVLVEGESGVGKTCLVRCFVDRLALETPDLVVLAGRCYEREAVPYKAFDGVVDALTRLLMHETSAVTATLVPTRPAPLAQVFPVLRRVPAFASAAMANVQALDPLEIRSRAFSALRDLLARLGGNRPLVVVIDDLQWADADSLALLAEVMRPPDAPAMLLIATLRASSGGGDTTFRTISAHGDLARAIPGDVRGVPLARLSDEEGRDLAERLLERAAGPGGATSSAWSTAEEIAREADGHPFFIDALVRHPHAGGVTVGRLEEALWASVERLEPIARRIMELVAVAGAPITQEALAGAAQVPPEAFERQVAWLRVAHLVIVTGARAADTVEPYHDRVRAAVMAHLDPATQAESHLALARALERTGSEDAEALAQHWRGAGDSAKAAKYTVSAGDTAAAALAFERAVTLYERALRFDAFVGAEQRALNEKLGTALANAGRGARAAAAYGEAAAGAPPAHALDLLRRSADQLLRSGHFDEGLAATRQVLASIGMKLPNSALSALLFLLLLRLLLRIRGTGFRSRDTTEVSAAELVRLDICWSTAFGLAFVDTMRGAAFQTRGLLLALRAGEPVRIARGLAGEAGLVAIGGGPAAARVEALLAKARQLAEGAQHRETLAFVTTTTGVAAYLAGRFPDCLEQCDLAQQQLRGECVGMSWETATAQTFSLWALAQLGALDELRRRQALYLREATERGDVYAAVHMRAGDSVLGWLADDDPKTADRETTQVMAQWSKQGFFLEHVYELYARTHADLYAGNAARAHARFVERWRALRLSMLRRIQVVRIQTLQGRARAALALAETEPQRAGPLLEAAARDARAIERERMDWAIPLAKLVRAGIEGARGRHERAAPLLKEAIAGFDAARMELYAAAARRSLGVVVGGDEGSALVASAEEWMRAETVKKPARMAAMLAPGFGRAR